MKKILIAACLLLSFPAWAQDFLTPSAWWFNDTTMPLNDYRYQYMCDEHLTPTGFLAWQNDTIAFAEYQHYEFYKLYVMKAPRHWVRILEQMAEAATMTANHFVGDIVGASLSFLYTPAHVAENNSPVYGRAVQLDSLMNEIIASVMQNDSASMYGHIIAADNLGSSFRRDYPLSWYRPSVGIGYSYRGKFDFDTIEREHNRRWQWMKPLTEQHDLFHSSGSISSESPSMSLDGQYLSVTQQCTREVDSVMLNQFALDRREEFVQLSRTLFVGGYQPKVEITLSDTVTQRRCEVDEWHCRMRLPSSDRLSEVEPPKEQGTFIGNSPQSWQHLIYIPKDLEDCMRQLDSVLSAEDKAYIQKEGAATVHFSLGMWMRNNWGLWGGSQLQTYFIDNGIQHPDDMSGVILDCYVKHLRGEEVNYKRMLRKAHRKEVEWEKKEVAWEKEEQKKWEYVDRYRCDINDSTTTFEMATAFLNLPLTVDPVVGTQIYKREDGEPEEMEMRLIEKILQRKPLFAPRPDALVRNTLNVYYGRQPKGPVKQMVQEDVDGLHRYEYHFNPDGTLAEVRGWNRKSDTSQFHTWRDEYIYHEGKLVTERNYKDDTLKKETRYIYLPDNRLQTYSYSPASPEVAIDSNSCILSPEGLLLVTFRDDGSVFRINEYDTLGREVTVLWYRDRCLSDWWSNVYDDAQNLCYEIHRSVFEHFVSCYVHNEQGDILGECCAVKLDIFDRKKTYYSYRYDRQGNWTRRYEMGKLSTRCKIIYY